MSNGRAMTVVTHRSHLDSVYLAWVWEWSAGMVRRLSWSPAGSDERRRASLLDDSRGWGCRRTSASAARPCLRTCQITHTKNV